MAKSDKLAASEISERHSRSVCHDVVTEIVPQGVPNGLRVPKAPRPLASPDARVRFGMIRSFLHLAHSPPPSASHNFGKA